MFKRVTNNLTCTVFIIIFLISSTSCNKKKNSSVTETDDIQELINKASLTSVEGNLRAPVLFLDSALEGKDLKMREKLKVLSYKSEVINNQLHQYDKANLLVDSMFKLIETRGLNQYKTEYALANYHKGDILFNQRLYNEAYTYYYKARAVGKTNLDSCTLSEYNFRLAVVLYGQARFEEAGKTFLLSYNQSLKCQTEFFRYYRMQQVLDNIGLSYYKSGKYDSALLYYNKALDIVNTTGNTYKDREALNDVARAVIYGNMADIYRLKSDSVRAKELLKQSIAINVKKGNDNKDAQFSQVKLAEIYLNEGSTDSLLMTLNVLKKGLDTVANTRAEMDWNRLMWIYLDQKNTTAAYRHLKNYNALRDTLEKETNLLKSVDLNQQIKTLENQYQIQSLQKDNEIKNVYLWAAVIASILAVIIAFFIFRSLIRSRKNFELLKSLNQQVNEQKQQLQNALATVEEKNRQQERILRAVAHDLRGPVATISMLSDLIEQEENADSRKEMIGFIRTSCNNSLELIAEILEAADQSKREEQEKESVSINALVKSSVELIRLKAAEKQQQIELDVPKQEVFLLVNAEKIKRVINNLITNAIKFSPKESQINVKLIEEDGALITIEDNGIGIPDDIKDKVFDMFTEAKRKGTAGELPYGLGLSICKQIVEAHNGKIWFTSRAGEGTTFYVKLPL